MSESASGAQTTSGGNAIICRSELPQYELPKESWKKFVPMVDIPFWPDSGIEWYLTRPRKKYQHRQLKTLYQWPPPELVQNQHVQATGKLTDSPANRQALPEMASTLFRNFFSSNHLYEDK